MATAFAHDVPDTSSPLATAASKLALVASAGAVDITGLAEALEGGDPALADAIDAQALDRKFYALVSEVAAKPDAAETFKTMVRAWRRIGAAPSDDPTDAKLLSAWEDWKSACLAIEGVGVGNDFKTDEPHIKRQHVAEQAIIEGTAATVAGALVKLRFALDCVTNEDWACNALYRGDDLALMARAEQLATDAGLIIDSIGFLTRTLDTGDGDLAHAIAEAKRLEVEASAYATNVAKPARIALSSALAAAEASVPHRTTTSSYESAFGERVFMSTERPISIEVGRRFLDDHADGDDADEFIVTCREGVALLDERNRLVADAKARATIEHDVDGVEAEEGRRWDAFHDARDAIAKIRCASPAELLIKLDCMVEDGRLEDEDTVATLRADIEGLALRAEQAVGRVAHKPEAEAFARAADAYSETRSRVNAEGRNEPDGGPLEVAFLAASDALDAAEPATFEQFVRKYALCFDDVVPNEGVQDLMVRQAKRLLQEVAPAKTEALDG